MAGFNDLVIQAVPALVGGGVSASHTEGKDWTFVLTNFRDSAGDLIDLTTVTGTCVIYDRKTEAALITPTVTGGVGTITITVPDATTTGMAGGADSGRKCRWGCYLTLSGVKVQVFMPVNSPFTIYREN